MGKRRTKDGPSVFDQVNTSCFDEDLQKKIKESLGTNDPTTLRLAGHDIDAVLRAYRTHRLMPHVSEERDRLNRIHRAAKELLTDLENLSPRSHFALAIHVGTHGDFTFKEFLPLLRELEGAVSRCREEFRGDPKRERREVEKFLVALLVKVFHTYYPPRRPRRGSKSTYLKDMTEFVVHCLSAAGVPNIPDEPTLYRRYIMPARKRLGRLAAV